MKQFIFLFLAFLIPTSTQTQTVESLPEATVVALHDEATFEYLPPVTVTTDEAAIEIISSDTHFVSELGIERKR